ncbi:YugN family protein [Cytobacillus kochii]|uniref:YugN family protein n=1 Tax=Cytobacillus kochii TaxID=859143 RepID=UPI001CD68BFA|nr:YugN family protein [Cytobacillus kochii]MCA1027652.1 YugN-like family protein [Cytobacillus kochii]MCM3321839.1 YugN-like family protein [Cytobacillus kochii]MCM3343327.1 YugN-like family protein [Cytobacillus kochii]MDM5207157.1 YugN family protein [Cytobacillus kochii]
MKLENTGLENKQVELKRLDDLMDSYQLVRAGQWDYERVTYDRKFELKEGIYYLRIFGHAVEGDVGARKATIQLLTPLLGKHYYPHGVEYGDGEHFPQSLVKQSEKILTDINNDLEQILK